MAQQNKLSLNSKTSSPEKSYVPYILLVEDEPTHVAIMSHTIRSADPHVILKVATSLKEYRNVIENSLPEIALIDMHLPDGKALEVLSSPLEARLFPVVVMTSSGDEKIAVKAMKAGAIDYIVKTTETFRTMPHIIERALREWRLIQEHKQAEEELRESELRFRSLYENVTIGLYRTTPAGKILLANHALVKMLGYPTFEKLAETNLKKVGYAEPSKRKEFLKKIEMEGKVNDYESAWTREDGSAVFVRESARAIRDSKGKTLYYDGAVEDITERRLAQTASRQAEEALRESEERFKYIFDHSAIGKSITFPSGDINVNDAFCEMVGYTKEELQHKRWQDITHSDDIELTQRAMDLLISGEQHSTRFIKRFIHKNGSIICVDIGSSLRCDNEGKPLYFMTTLIDITERKRIEDALRLRESYLSAIIENQRGLLWLKDRDGRFLAVNSKFANACGLDNPEFIVNKTDLDVWPRELAERYIADDNKVIQSKNQYTVEELISDKGDIHWFETFKTPIIDKQGMVIGTTGYSHDITERKQTEVALQNKERYQRALLDNFPFAVWMKDTDCRFLAVNQLFAKTFNISTADELLGKSDFDITEHSIAEEYRAHDRTVMASRQKNIAEQEIRGLGEHRWFETYKAPVIGKNNELLGTVGFLRDITERKRSDGALQESENQFRELWEATVEGITIVDHGVIVEVNDAMCKIFGTSREQSIGKSMFEFAPAEVHDSIRERLRSGIEGRFEIPALRVDGARITLETFAKKVTFRGKSLRLIAVRDITARKQMEESLQNERNILRTLIDTLPDKIYIKDTEGRFIICNQTTAVRMGASNPEDIIGKSDFELLPRELAEQFHADEQEIIQSGRPLINHEEPLDQLSGTTRWNLVTKVPFRDHYGNIKGIVGSARDITKQKQVERTLRENEQFFRLLFTTSPDSIILFDPFSTTVPWEIIDCNEVACRMNGYSREELIGKSVDMLNAKTSTFDELESHLQKLQREGVLHFETLHRHRDGRQFPIEVASAIVTLGGRQLILGIDRDITERKRVEEELQESEERMRAIVEGTPHLFFYNQDNEANITYVSATVKQITGYEADIWLKRKDWFITAAQMNQAAKNKTVAHLRGEFTKEPVIIEIHHAAGNPILLEIYEYPKLKYGKVVGLQGVVHDITDRKLAEEALRESEEKFRKAFTTSPDSININRLNDGMFVSINQGFARLMGYTEEDILGKTSIEINIWYDLNDRIKLMEGLKKDGVVENLVARFCSKTGEIKHGMMSASIIELNGVKHILSITRDITERTLLEEQLRQMQKLEGLGTLAGGIAHDFNNILGIILAYITTIKRFKDDSKKIDLAIETITSAVRRGTTLVQQILTFARKTETAFGAVNVNDVVTEIMTMIMGTFPKIMTYSQSFDKTVPYINADHSQLYQALLNLCVNARDAMPTGGLLSINTHLESVAKLHDQHPDADASSYICLEVCDTGEGMTPETQKHIFEPFFTTKGIGKGTGLGLAVVFGIVQTHKGFIDVESELGRGTTFRLYLPVSQVAVPIKIKEDEILEDIPGGTETVLIIEDEEMLRMSLQMVLMEKGYKVLSACDGITALKIYQENKNDIALVLTDLGLPTMTGLEICQRIRKIDPQEHLILATGFLDPDTKLEFLKAGIEHFLYKPYDLTKVLIVVREVLDKK